MPGPVPLPKGITLGGPGNPGVVNGVPVIRRNVPLLLEVAAPSEADDVVVIMWHGPAPNEQPRQALIDRIAEIPAGGTPPVDKPELWNDYIQAALEPNLDPLLVPWLLYLKRGIRIATVRTVECPPPMLPSIRNVCHDPPSPYLQGGRRAAATAPASRSRAHPARSASAPRARPIRTPPPCPAGQHSEGGKCVPDGQPGPARWGVWFDEAELHLGTHHGWTFVVGWRAPFPFGDGKYHFEDFTVWIDPSGFVRTTKGLVLPGAKVALFRADAAAGPFAQVKSGSAVMSPANRRNPDVTDANGHFGWDVIAGFYRVRASLRGCTSPKKARQAYVDSKVYAIPPPVFDVDLRLKCPPGPAATRKPAVTGTARVGRTLRCAPGAWKGGPTLRYAWRRDRGLLVRARTATYRVVAADAGARISCEVTAKNRFGVRAVRSAAVRVRA